MKSRSGLKKFFIFLIVACLCGAGVYVYTQTDLLKPKYEITFDANGGECETEMLTVTKGNCLELPVPTREGYDFEGWFCGELEWTNELPFDSHTLLKALWKAKKFNITFIVEGEEFVQQEDYDTIPVFDGTLEKTPTATIEYIFSGWTPAIQKVTGDVTYTANFTAQERKYDVILTSNEKDSCVFSGDGEFSYLEDTTISVNVKHGFEFVGWFVGETLYSTQTTLDINDIDEDISLVAKVNVITATINYYDTKNAENSNLKTYDVRNGRFYLEGLHLNGYKFDGWFTQTNGNGTKIESIDATLLKNYDLYACWSIETYTITYELNDGEVSLENPTSYTVETDSITLNSPTKTEFEFLGWTGTGLPEITKNVVIEKGSFGNRTYIAIWKGRTISLSVDGLVLYKDEIAKATGETIEEPTIDTAVYGMSGYDIDGWYTDSECTNKYTFSTMPSEGITLYGKWVYAIGEGFYPYLDKFNAKNKLTKVQINSFDELVSWTEYIEFYNITEKYPIKLTYKNINGQSILDEFNDAFDKSTYPANCKVGFSTTGYTSEGYIYISKSYADTEATLVCDESKLETLPQQDYAYALGSAKTRNGDFSEFNINNVAKTISVSTSNQLVYALEKGLKPICMENSKAENVYNKAKQVLIEVIDDSMSDIEKLRAIYEWLVMNVQYDNLAADKSDQNTIEWQKYDSWYAEGVFNNKKAVCDGIAKAFLILAKIENIPTIRVDGNNHAWNKVFVDGKWYGIDATHGNVVISEDSEILSYTSFLFTDNYKEFNGYYTTDYEEFEATTVFNIYDYMTFGEFDLMAESETEVYQIVKYVKDFVNKSDYYTIEISIAYSTNLNSLMSSVYYNTGVYVSAGTDMGTDSAGNDVYVLFFA